MRIQRLLVLFFLVATSCAEAREMAVRVMTFNLWVGGEGGKQPIEQSAAVIKAAQADVAGLQETHGGGAEPTPDNAKKIAALLGWNYCDQGGRKAVITRFPIETNTPQKQGVSIRLPDGRRAFVFNAHFFHAPYQPYQLASIPYAGGTFLKTEAEAVAAAEKARGHEVALLLSELRVARMSGLPVFLTGDFNEPSHLDWTEAAARAGIIPVKVNYPATRQITETGLRDSFRELFPDAVAKRGYTWTPIRPANDPAERHDRIDFVFFSGESVRAEKCEIIGENNANADIVVRPYPSDHRAVVATFQIGPPEIPTK